MSSAQAKDEIRHRVWSLLERQGAAEGDPAGRIPRFQGAREAAERLAATDHWRGANAVKVNPDRAQHQVRALALGASKATYMAVPKLALDQPFYLLNSLLPSYTPDEAATRDAAEAHSLLVGVEAMQRLDLVVSGSVAVNRDGARIGKGRGYADIEYGMLTEAGLIDDRTVIATTVHDLQVLDEPIPEEPHDFRVDLVVTPTRIIRCPRTRRPHGLHKDRLTAEQLAEIPLLDALMANTRGGPGEG
ncbi:5-formyltetrahydrofolate cyclo-ligase [Glycomyces artemisiae]|uniref:5-formyltetrahydrofolate cyclo-ligase n=1 Tax=Glycomyces artemisiae TaxID=1076443 RepID=A0A2T0UH31_9ACTN|nr:5-formyltetrahydrofolate cyclo-ligase [Glycomyces artemisiae]PRY57245.1 5-formyltetrahydrofolate cyclo-ligase [Glycomyces artemisiae]